MSSRAAVGLLVALAAGLLSGCSAGHAASPAAGTCLAGPASTPGAGPPVGAVPPVGASSPPGVAGGQRMPDVALDCFDGTGAVRLDDLARPAVVSLWASWCLPCHEELPHVAAFARTAGGAVAVIGVDTGDTHAAGQATMDSFAMTYPMLFDPDKLLSNAVGRNGLPVTLFVSPGGVLRYVYFSPTPLDLPTLASLTLRYLGVRVAG